MTPANEPAAPPQPTAAAGEPGAGAAPGRVILPVASGAQTLAAVGALLRGRRLQTFTAVGVLTLGTGIGLLTAPILGRMVDLVAGQRGAASLTVPMVLLLVVAVGRGAATGLGSALVARLGETVLAGLRERFIDRALNLPLERVEQAGSGDLTSRVTGDVTLITRVVRQALPEFTTALLTIVLTLAGLAVLDWRFLAAVLLAVPVHVLTVRWYIPRAVPVYAAHRVANGALQHQLLDSVGGVRTVRAFRLTDQHAKLLESRSREAVDLALRGIRLVSGFFSRLNLAEFIGLAAVLVTGFLLVGNGSVSIGTATAAALYFHSLFNPVNAALFLIDDAQSAGASLARLVGVSDLPAEEDPADAARPADGSVRVRELSHAYASGHPVLDAVDLEVRDGERVALVGASGAGKTTLAKLIAGVHRPTGGSVELGGADTRALGPAGVRRAVTLISQEVHVFAGPLAEDLRLARPGATDAEITAALARVDALTWVEALPEGAATVVGEGGHRLTVTQAQQLALARLVLADPPVAILDEATADAGSAGARTLEGAALRALEGRTGLMVAHRLPQAATADRIVVLDRGRVVESGTHAALVAAGGSYAALWSAWSDSRRTGAEEAAVPRPREA
ncbi:ABC transporter ATP-binding protein [Streptomyces subrutilus]|uniref:ABC transporter ATP-binding protein n=1 Tax=Streptomyces subrutilus TaxID=36818 RepID=A0A5P2UEF5_9ACTN|nr:ABC transporter ATP-binding protein [Streptomyces subrutilus]QEU77653.1 ABC transporter ATP-binding protein [Streptomyces subrutilus]WSJ33249.1 ABC transporter ATP-binding protein/permease [Streptomyces subrutilus]GGZ64988.1 multidrug ABC transporter permease [Streptomyces subrutilus]